MATAKPGEAIDRPKQPLSLQHWPVAPGLGSALGRRFEYGSNGDRVPGRLLLPRDASGPCAVVLLQHGAGSAKDAAELDAVAAPWVRGGVAVASIDLPLHGERRSPKLSQRLLDGLAAAVAGEAIPSRTASLLSTFADQALQDLAACADALAELPGVDERRLVYAGFSLGAILGARFCARDPRPCAAVLAAAGGGFSTEALDACGEIAGLAPRPLLMLNGSRDRIVSRRAAEALFAAAREPRQIEWYDADHHDLPAAALKRMWSFIQEQLAGVAARAGRESLS